MLAFSDGGEVAGCRLGEGWIAGLVVALDHGLLSAVRVDLAELRDEREDESDMAEERLARRRARVLPLGGRSAT